MSALPARPRGLIEIAVHNARWPVVFATEQARLQAVLHQAGVAGRVVAIEHIGSTAVPGLGSKPVVDLMIGMQSSADVTAFPAAALTQLGYVARPFLPSAPPRPGAPPPAPRLLFSKYTSPTTNVHVFAHDDARWRGHAGVRDYLRAHPKVAATYDYLKRVYAARYGSDQLAYARAKRPFLNSVENLALNRKTPVAAKKATMQTRLAAAVRSIGIGGPGDGGPGPGPHHGPGGHPGTTAPPPNPSDPFTWQPNVWYERTTSPSGFSVAANQDPRGSGAIGMFYMYDPTSTVAHIYGRGDPGSSDPTVPDASAIAQEEPVVMEITRDDGTTFTEALYPAGYTIPGVPMNAQCWTNIDQTTTCTWNNDGSPWTGPVPDTAPNVGDPTSPDDPEPDDIPSPDDPPPPDYSPYEGP